MPGRWVTDDDQSLYYLDEENDDQSTLEIDCNTHPPTRQSIPPQGRVRGSSDSVCVPSPGIRHRKKIATRRKTIPTATAHDLEYVRSNLRWRRTLSEVTETADLSRSDALRSAVGSRDRAQLHIDLGHAAAVFDRTFAHPLTGLNLVMGFNTSLPTSQLDVYITVFRQLVRCCFETYGLAAELQRAVTAEGVLWVVREAWPAAEGYWNLTATFRGFLHAELWRNFPCERSYRQLPPAYRPTRAQVAIPHSPMIDWLPWPDVRDMAIKYQDQIDLDDLFRMAIHNLVAHRRGLGPRRHSFRDRPPESSPMEPIGEVAITDETSFRVWDLVCLEKAKSTNPLTAEPGLEKKPVLQTPELRALSRAYDLEYDEFDTQKLDDYFFEAYPCLYADTAASGWKVKSFPNLQQIDVGRPAPLTRPAVFRLKSKIESLVGAEITI